MLTRLGELLRLTLRAELEHETPLHEELALLERYLAIMRIRFADRVTVRCDVEPAVPPALVPSFILQPLVENAFEHGVARLQRAGEIRIEAREAGDALALGDGARTHLVRETMKSLEAKVDPARFVRIHRSTIVNVDRIARIEPLGQGEYRVTMRSGARFESSRAYGERMQALLR